MGKRHRRSTQSLESPNKSSPQLNVKFRDVEDQVSMAMANEFNSFKSPKRPNIRMPMMDTPDPRQKSGGGSIPRKARKSSSRIEDLSDPEEATPAKRAKLVESASKLNGSIRLDFSHHDEEEAENDDSEDEGESLGSKDTLTDNEINGQQQDEKDSFVVEDEEEDDLIDDDVSVGEDGEEQSDFEQDVVVDEEDATDPEDLSSVFTELGYDTLVADRFCLALSSTRKPQTSLAFKPFVFSKMKLSEDDSISCGLGALQWMITPCENQRFFKHFYQRSALVVKRGMPDFYRDLFSTRSFLKMLEENTLEYGKNINIAVYENGVRTTQNGVGRVSPAVIRDCISRGQSVQCVNPQSYDKNLHYICEILQEAFSCFVGANSYITPKESEGFAPHWDDIDAFILQLEGRKYWKVSAPLTDDDKLPLVSSGNFNDDILKAPNREVVFDGYLDPGDLMYLPRGFIHKAHTTDQHSLHVTISASRNFSYSNFLTNAFENLIEKAAAEHSNWRVGLPPMLFNISGVANITYSSDESHGKMLWKICSQMLPQLSDEIKTSSASLIDSMVHDFMRVALPPLLSPGELRYSALNSDVDIYNSPKLLFYRGTKVRLIRRHAQRLIYTDESTAHIVHRMANSMFYDETREPTTFKFPLELEEGFIKLCNNYPHWTKASELNLTMDEARKLIRLLYRNCLLLIQNSAPQQKNGKKIKKNKKAK